MSPGRDIVHPVPESRTDAFLLLDADWHLTHMNAAARQFLVRHGMDPDAMLGRHLWNELFPGAQGRESAPYMFKAMNERVPVAFEYYYAPWDTWTFTQFDPLPDGGLANFFADITPAKRTEDSLRRSQALLAEAQRLAQIGSWNFDVVNGTVQWSDEHYRLFGLRPEEATLTYEVVVQNVHPDDRDLIRRVTAQALRDHQPFEYNLRTRPRDGAERVLCSRGQVVLDERGVPVRMFGTAQDITERERYQDQLERQEEWLERLVAERTEELERATARLRRTERMASLGTLAAGLGHDVGNLLLPLEVRLRFLDQANLGHDASEHIAGIRQCVDYLRRLSSGLQLLALDPEVARSSDVTELSAWWNDVSPIITNLLPHGMEFEHSFPAETCWITISPVALTQAAFNLVQNAVDAMRERGSGCVRVDAMCDHDGSTVILQVIDDGPGMPEETVRHCTEPYFSTKTRGVTTGMGLSIVHGMAEAAGGRLEIESTFGQGTTVRLRLPMTAGAEAVSGR